MYTKTLILASALLVLLAFAGTASAEIIPAEYQYFHGTYVNYPGIGNIAPGWTRYATPILAQENTDPSFYQYPSQSQFLRCNSSGGIMINVTTVPGRSYTATMSVYFVNGTSFRMYWYPNGWPDTNGSALASAAAPAGWKNLTVNGVAGGTRGTLLIRGNGVNNFAYVTYASVSSPDDAPPAQPPVAGFSESNTLGETVVTWPGQANHFVDASTGDPTSWAWDFDDDGINDSTAQNPECTYANPGSYTVTLYASNAGGTSKITKTDYVQVAELPVADFEAVPTSGFNPLEVQFNDLSSGSLSGSYYQWDFDGDGVNDSTEASPVCTYSAPGVYTVTHWVGGDVGDVEVLVRLDAETKTGYITVNEIPVAKMANFTANVTKGKDPLTVQFNDTSNNDPTGWAWDFGDGYKNSTVQNPVHVYNASGNYTVTLTTTNATHTNTTVMVGYIVVGKTSSATGGMSIAMIGGVALIVGMIAVAVMRKRD